MKQLEHYISNLVYCSWFDECLWILKLLYFSRFLYSNDLLPFLTRVRKVRERVQMKMREDFSLRGLVGDADDDSVGHLEGHCKISMDLSVMSRVLRFLHTNVSYFLILYTWSLICQFRNFKSLNSKESQNISIHERKNVTFGKTSTPMSSLQLLLLLLFWNKEEILFIY